MRMRSQSSGPFKKRVLLIDLETIDVVGHLVREAVIMTVHVPRVPGALDASGDVPMVRLPISSR